MKLHKQKLRPFEVSCSWYTWNFNWGAVRWFGSTIRAPILSARFGTAHEKWFMTWLLIILHNFDQVAVWLILHALIVPPKTGITKKSNEKSAKFMKASNQIIVSVTVEIVPWQTMHTKVVDEMESGISGPVFVSRSERPNSESSPAYPWRSIVASQYGEPKGLSEDYYFDIMTGRSLKVHPLILEEALLLVSAGSREDIPKTITLISLVLKATKECVTGLWSWNVMHRWARRWLSSRSWLSSNPRNGSGSEFPVATPLVNIRISSSSTAAMLKKSFGRGGDT